MRHIVTDQKHFSSIDLPDLGIVGTCDIYSRTLKTHHHIFALFLQTVYAIEKLFTGFNVQPRIGMNQSLI